MKTPQVKPDWATGIYNGRTVMVPDKTPTFEVWLKQCDKVVMGKLGLSLHDLADANWRGYYDDELSAFDACDCAFEDTWSDEMPHDLWWD